MLRGFLKKLVLALIGGKEILRKLRIIFFLVLLGFLLLLLVVYKHQLYLCC